MLLMPGKDKKKRVASIILSKMMPDFVGRESGGYDKEFEKGNIESDENQGDMGAEAVCEKVIDCVNNGDAKGMASYMKDLVEMLHGNSETY